MGCKMKKKNDVEPPWNVIALMDISTPQQKDIFYLSRCK